MMFYRARELSVQDQQLQMGQLEFLGRGLNGDYHGLRRKLWDIRLCKMVNFGFFSIYFTNPKLLILKLIFHLHNTIKLESARCVSH